MIIIIRENCWVNLAIFSAEVPLDYNSESTPLQARIYIYYSLLLHSKMIS